MNLELRATPEEVMRAVEALQEFGREQQLEEKEIFGLALALEECASNIVNHAYGRNPKRKFSVTFGRAGSEFKLELRDDGIEFDPTSQSPVERAGQGEDRPPGGWGIQLVRHYTDQISYQRQNGENILRLTKRLGNVDPI